MVKIDQSNRCGDPRLAVFTETDTIDGVGKRLRKKNTDSIPLSAPTNTLSVLARTTYQGSQSIKKGPWVLITDTGNHR